MANITYRESSDPTLPDTTVTKASPLTNIEVDANFKALNDDIQTRALTSNVTSLVQTQLNYISSTAASDSLSFAIALG